MQLFYFLAPRDGTLPPGGNSPGRRRKAFTLIELLVVISIIGILAAILFPVFARAREQARRASCANNLKQISIAIKQYNQDFDEYFFPTQVSGGGTPGHGATFVTQLMPYLKNRQVFLCPSGTRTTTGTVPVTVRDFKWVANGAGWRENSEGHYGFNLNLNDLSGGLPAAMSLADVQRPAQTAMLFDGGWYEAAGPLDPQVAGAMRHLEGANMSFADGHVKFYPGSKIIAGVVDFLP